jgi:hypothetical protein
VRNPGWPPAGGRGVKTSRGRGPACRGRVVPDASRLADRTIRGNLAWAVGYDVAALSLAAAGLLNPLIAGAAMSLTSVLPG